jgi:hypothetical protein
VARGKSQAPAIKPAWKLVYFDDGSVVYLREDGPYGELVRRDAFRVLDPMRLPREHNFRRRLRGGARRGGPRGARERRRRDRAVHDERGSGASLAPRRVLGGGACAGRKAAVGLRDLPRERALALDPESRAARDGIESTRRGSAALPALPAADAESK